MALQHSSVLQIGQLGALCKDAIAQLNFSTKERDDSKDRNDRQQDERNAHHFRLFPSCPNRAAL